MRVSCTNAKTGSNGSVHTTPRMVVYLTPAELKKATGKADVSSTMRATLRQMGPDGLWGIKIDRQGQLKVQPYKSEGKRGGDPLVAQMSFTISDFGHKWIVPTVSMVTPQYEGQGIRFAFPIEAQEGPGIGRALHKVKDVDPLSILKKAKDDFNAAVELLLGDGYEVTLTAEGRDPLKLTGKEGLKVRQVKVHEADF